MGKGGKKTKLVKPDRQGNSKPETEERVSIVRQPPSPIPEETENASVAQGSPHQEPSKNDWWSGDTRLTNAAPAPTPGSWYASPRQSGAASSRTGDFGRTSWAGKSDRSSVSRDPPRRPSSPYPNTASVDLDRDDTRSAGDDELDYISDKHSDIGSNANIQQQWNTATQDQSQMPSQPPPQTSLEQPKKPSPMGPSLNIYTTSFSNPPVAPNPLPAPPNVLSRASEVAARMDRSKKGDPPPPQPTPLFPLPPAAWHDWIKPGTYAPKPEPPVPPHAPPQALPRQAPGLAGVGSIAKGPIPNQTRGIWDLKHGKGLPPSAQMHQSRGRPHAASGQWSHRRSRSSVDGWGAQHRGGGHGALNDGGWGATGEGGGWGMTGEHGGLTANDGGWGATGKSGAWTGNDGGREMTGKSGAWTSNDGGWGMSGKSGAWPANDGGKEMSGKVGAWTSNDGGWGMTGKSGAWTANDGGREMTGKIGAWTANDGGREMTGKIGAWAANDGGWGMTGKSGAWTENDGGREMSGKGGAWTANDGGREMSGKSGAWTANDGGWGTTGKNGAWTGQDGGREMTGRNGAWTANDGAWPGNGEGNARHGRSKSEGGWGRKRNVQWEEEESSSEETESEEENDYDDGWGERDASGRGRGGSGQTQWPKPDNAQVGWDQGGWNQAGGLGHQSTSWGEGRKSQHATNASLGADAREIVSPQQKAQILNSLLNMPNQMPAGQAGHNEYRTGRLASKGTKKESRRQTQYNPGWGWGDESWGNTHEDEDGDDEEEEEEDHRPRNSTSKRVSTSWDTWAGSQEASRYSMPSLTMAHAYKDTKTRLDSSAQSKLDDVTKIRFHESRGAALVQVQNAFFGQARLPRDRIHWSFPPDKDERVRIAFSWVQEMSYGLATLGVHKYLQHRERGGLFINADYRSPDRPQDFGVDYMTFDELQHSRDQTLQVSVISYDPAMTVVVFVFLPSKTGNSIAIWRRKLRVPNNARLRFQKELAIALAGLKDPQAYEVYVEEVPKAKKDLPNLPRPEGQTTKPKKKRKWWQLFKLFKS